MLRLHHPNLLRSPVDSCDVRRDDGWLAPIANTLQNTLGRIKSELESLGVQQSAGWSIICLVAFVKLVTYPLTKKQVRQFFQEPMRELVKSTLVFATNPPNLVLDFASRIAPSGGVDGSDNRPGRVMASTSEARCVLWALKIHACCELEEYLDTGPGTKMRRTTDTQLALSLGAST